jgi:hypothetical protein
LWLFGLKDCLTNFFDTRKASHRKLWAKQNSSFSFNYSCRESHYYRKWQNYPCWKFGHCGCWVNAWRKRVGDLLGLLEGLMLGLVLVDVVYVRREPAVNRSVTGHQWVVTSMTLSGYSIATGKVFMYSVSNDTF